MPERKAKPAVRSEMGKYCYKALNELKDQQVRFTPLTKRLEQIDNAESLLVQVDAIRQYPYQFVFYRITGFRAESYSGLLMEGNELQHDLRLFIEDLSASTGVDAAAAGEPVLTIEQLSKKLGVSTKTIHRWRSQGLVSRRFVFDGRARVGFLQSSVDRFVRGHNLRVDRGARFCHLAEGEKELIVQRARRMASASFCRPVEIIRRIARKLGRSPETVRYTIKAYDRQNADSAVFGNATGPLREPQKAAVYEAYCQGRKVGYLAERFRRTRSSIYRIINEMRARHLLAQKLDYTPNPAFEESDASDVMLGPMPASGQASRVTKLPKGLPPYLATLYEVPLLTKEQEQFLFRRLNFLKYNACRLRERLDPVNARSSVLDAIEQYQQAAEEVKNQIIRANLRLVVSIAKRHISTSKNFDELVSDGNMSLIRAVEKFDFARGNKFSTYASWAIMKNFARSIPAEYHQHDRYVTGHEELFQSTADTRGDEHTYISQVRQMRRSIVKILTKLDERERSIIISRFGLGKKGRKRTLEQLGHQLGVTKERVRQLEVRAMGKLRRFANEEHIDLLEE